ncbi:hypothetical protein [Aequorivita lipolytica]|uniref:Type II toxin-antitoxin system PemK/MazF family toxin n=1 Tax=Aequorivita lipolytica TaxID=153267 RepID=A0A5C6YKR5_9FLAO|nr:hypothetical protein [Aequorivita lipolytica]TXD67789.1 hypothetical protein ESV24_15085 [Aequorivita lipolytica]SRX54137.1 hypothetical protein AEQU2_03055 [Aequorivita lipolytica]
MFEEGAIIYFDPFYFKNGNTAKPKYFIVLKNQANKNILASLPTRTDSIPKMEEIENGCIELPSINLNCFVISNNIQVTECGKSFDFKTHIYGHQIDDYDIEFLKEIYPLENTDYEIWGKMKNELFLSLIACLRNSKSVKRKYLKILRN